MNRRLFLSILAGAASNAHDLYLMPEQFHIAEPGPHTVWFHLGDSFPESEVAVHADRLVNPRAISARRSVALHDFKTVGKRVCGNVDLNTEGSWVLAVETIPNRIDLAAESFEKYLEHEGLTHVLESRAASGASKKNGVERYTKFVKSLLTVGAPDGFAQRPVGLSIEIVPENDPFKLKAGASLPIQVLFEGKPAEGLQIQAAIARKGNVHTEAAGRTDADGRLTLPLQSAGVWRLHTILMRPYTGTGADWESFWASMTFEIR